MGEGLRHALPHQEQRQHQAQRQQAVEGGTGHVDPEVTQGLGRFATDPTAQSDQDGQPGGRADEVLHSEADHLAEVTQGRLTAVGLPIGVGDETDCGVEGQSPFQAWQLLRIQGEAALEQQDREQQHKAREVEREQGQHVFLPALFLMSVDTGHAITGSFYRPQHRGQPGALALHHLVIEPPEERRGHQHHREKGDDQPIVITVHSLLPSSDPRVTAQPADK